ncbi:uncharacterized protein (DUF58 family) [Pullulanibacillus pueri]|uniref:DUF58 domain-containing protein n=1 Tax=Pullulanibacillus pueri TaxID=1437324 RepID=A0A8J2ZWX5_9BACL|nr:DUF58 domain-containing protein [Pullulanibacillus pueri]MBM7682783.1 uncharacterized protein (DUF58 family) [Pullulanibacillus pueri]GGH83166.1 hypothetical protein GCM10007096_23630 [Pullulanibacillus pueri]
MMAMFRRHRTLFGVVWVLILFCIAFAYAMFQGGFVSWFVFFGFVPILVYTLIVALYPLGDIRIERVMSKHELYADEPLEVTLKMTRRVPFPLFYLIIEDHQPHNILKKHQNWKRENAKKLLSLGFQLGTTLTYTIEGMPRGEYVFKKLSIRTGDIFGFIQRQKEIEIEDTVLVYPKMTPPESWSPLDLAYGGQRRSRKSFEHDVTSIASIREYIPGDRLSWLDWKSTARTNHLMTKQFEFPLNNDVILILDCTVNSADREGEAFERSVALAGSLMEKALRTESSVGFVTVGKETQWLELENQPYQKWKILNHLARIHQESSAEVSVAINKYIQHLSHHSTVIFVTTKVSKHLLLLFNDLMTRGLAIEFFLVTQNDNREGTRVLEQLHGMGVVTHHVTDDHFNRLTKGSGSLATS